MRRRLICRPRRSSWCSTVCKPVARISEASRSTSAATLIEDVLDEQDMVLPVRRLSDDGLKAWQQVIERGYEGLVAKDPQSAYVGGRTLKWLKVKQARYREGERGWQPRR